MLAASTAWPALALLLALLLAAAAYGLGALRSRCRTEQALRAARAEVRDLAALQDHWIWQTDAAHAPTGWQGPGQPPQERCPLLDDARLLQRLRSQQAFAGLRLALAHPLEGSHGWELRGVPRHDELGRFDGFCGSARPTDLPDAAQAAQAALAPLLSTHVGAAVLVGGGAGGWRVQSHNAAAAALWPGVAPGTPLRALLGALPQAVLAALDHAATAQPGAASAGSATAQPERTSPGGTTAPGSAGFAAATQKQAGPHPVAATPAADAAAATRTEAEGWLVVACGAGPARSVLLLRKPPGTVVQEAAGGENEQFSFTISHDLRAPIRVVEGFTRIVKEDYGRLLDRVGNDHLDRVLGATARMNLMIDALLTLARLSSQPLARQPVDLSQLAEYVVDELRRGAPERAAEVDIQPGLVVQGDPTLLRMVLENLLGNAWKYSARAAQTRISLHAVAHGAGSAYVVRDNGAGFDMRAAERLFGLFQRLHSASEFQGHGVGLASVRRIVRRHGGDVWAEAEPGKGASFYFTLAA